ncbi:CAP domain-containing protein [Apilactobacillus timberlakei]|uniref:CAP domain-containing protein n=1 Tax=Apilactobacillus timberlakei TaxID=2008380 RepID=UPI00112BE9B5|nr:CAP domain-containing protein [Apilactobacillus timberlakei]TPR13105.1 CAP domain-containing protein [Apilactobacillus timberlakei]TPR18042.1 CAP domain-containing protein [Apilactobacillus timberlakei]TPR19844.1 CAP domain-containing protein [Apilactobacillus timberlakei]TPR21382.1 CAP domain-containing protein [Apilactobacillus timberlakei]
MFFNKKSILIIGMSLLCTLTFSTNYFNAIASHKHKVLVTKKVVKHNKKSHARKLSANYKYIVGTYNYGGQLMDNDQFEGLKTGNFGYGSGVNGTLVHIVGHKRLLGKMFYKIVDKNNHINDGWTYAGNLSNKSNGKAHSINLNKFSGKLSDTISSINDHKASERLAEQVPTYLQQMKSQTLKDINNERQQRGISPLTETSDMDKIAAQRSQQLINNFSHYDKSGNTMYEQDAQNLGINLSGYSGENIAGADLGQTYMSNDPKTYNNKNGIDMANMDNDSMMNYDQDQGNGHRDNILNVNFSKIGIGTSYDSKSQSFYLSEDFKG